MQLSEVLRLFDSSLSQEQSWSVAYGVCKTLLIKKYEDHQRKERIRYVKTWEINSKITNSGCAKRKIKDSIQNLTVVFKTRDYSQFSCHFT